MTHVRHLGSDVLRTLSRKHATAGDREQAFAAAQELERRRGERESMIEAHAEGLHDELERDGCPECEAR